MDTAFTGEVKMNSFEIPYYHDYISPELFSSLEKEMQDFEGIKDLTHIGLSGGLENLSSMKFLCELYEATKEELSLVLARRIEDRKFIDQRVASCFSFNKKLKIDFNSPDYKTIIGLEDSSGRIVIGPKNKNFAKKNGGKNVSKIPYFLEGNHVTLFGPPDNAKLSINAMNAYHRKLKDEPAIIEELLKTHQSTPKWGADDEDSKTPLRKDLIEAGENLTKCFNKSLKISEDISNKTYELAKDKLSLPIKRFPGLALPSLFLFYKKNPLPLHLYDFALHLFKNWNNKEALVFYVPKLENEEEARYIRIMVETAEKMLKKREPSYNLQSIRLMIVLENPRAILRVNEIMDELYPYFSGASLGWHDYLASTARLFKKDGNYRIPVKADPNIVIKYIKGSHDLLATVVGSRGGIKVGGMYGILPMNSELASESFQVTMKGYIKDVITQLKRNLTGFWVAHPDFVRIGLALVEAWDFYLKGDKKKLDQLIAGLLNEKYHDEIYDFIYGEDIQGLDVQDPLFIRSLLVADIKESNFMANNNPEEVRYNIFQSLQYLADWLSGNGCVALPAEIDGVPVRVMDDLATAERSRWEVWHEIYHGRFDLYEFLKISYEELHFIRKDLSNNKKIVQVKWDERTRKWYPTAFNIMIKLMTDKNPVEFATELLLPFTTPALRNANDPWKEILKNDTKKFSLEREIEIFNYYFEMCGSLAFAKDQMKNKIIDLCSIRDKIMSFDKKTISEAAFFHGEIGENKKTLDSMAANEQSKIFTTEEKLKEKIKTLGREYKEKFDIKFLISAEGKGGGQILEELESRINNSPDEELENAKKALVEITTKRMKKYPLNNLFEKIEKAFVEKKIDAASISISTSEFLVQNISFGNCTNETRFELASLSKTFAAAFAIEYFAKNNIALDTSVNEVLKKINSQFKLENDSVLIKHLMNHSALNMHYVKGYPIAHGVPANETLLEEIEIINTPGENFQYSGGGFILLEYLIETHAKKNIHDLTKDFWPEFSFYQKDEKDKKYAKGITVKGEYVQGGRLLFPAFPAGAMGTASSVTHFLKALSSAFFDPYYKGPISHETAREMFSSTDLGCMKFMGCEAGLGVFVGHAEENKFAIHQGANEGFRAIYIHTFHGPNKGDGFTILCNGELNAVLFISEVAQMILQELKIKGINFNKFKKNFNVNNIPEEQIVNLGYKELIFDSFIPNLPEEIEQKGKLDFLSKKNLAINGKILEVTNQKFARAQNLLSPYEPVFDPNLFGRHGKIMDSWESARHNTKECDQLIFELQTPSEINFVSFSTKFHHGNHAPFVRLEGKREFENEWVEIYSKTPLEGHAYKVLQVEPLKNNFKEIRVSIFPDGGLTRLGLYKSLEKSEIKNFTYEDEILQPLKPLNILYKPKADEVRKNISRFKKGDEIDVASLAFGGRILEASNEHYGPAIQLISPFAPLNMFDGLESKRSREKNHFDSCTLSLAWPAKIHRIELDFTFFINNNPKFIEILGKNEDKNEWQKIIHRTDVKAFAGNTKIFEIDNDNKFEQIKIKTIPDGGVNRLKIFSFL